MTIYVTPFNNDTKQCTGASAPSGFDSLDQVATAMGDGFASRTEKTLIYGDGCERVLFSPAVFHIDGGGITD